jgi:hypothetical protein
MEHLPMHARIEIARADLRRTRVVADPDATRTLSPGQARLRTAQFALTANNITYAAFGETMQYWQFFPTGDAAWGCVPVWGFAEVVESRAEGVAVGERLYGYLPMCSHLVVQPARVSAQGFTDAAAHRQDLPALYNQMQCCRSDPGYVASQEGQQAVLRPLFITSFLIDDFLADNGFFGAQQVLLSSASSKTAYGTAHRLFLRRGTHGAPRVVGLTSATNLAFTASLGCYDEVRTYDSVSGMPADRPTVYVDFAGHAALRRRVHEHFADTLAYSCAVGGTHWADLGSGGGLPGPRPILFFAPAQAKKRSLQPPEGWGSAELQQRIAAAWLAFMRPVTDPARPWLVLQQAHGADAAQAAYLALLGGHADPRTGTMLSL